MPDNVTPAADPLDRACALVGRFLYEFARMERAIDQAIAKLFELTEDYAAVLTINIDFNRKVAIVHSACLLQEVSVDDARIENIGNVFKKIRGLNTPYRQLMAHSNFEPSGESGITFAGNRPQPGQSVKPRTINAEEFVKLFDDLRNAVSSLEDLTADLSSYSAVRSYQSLPISELRRLVARQTSAMRAFEAESSRERSKRDFEPGWQERIMRRSADELARWQSDLMPTGVALLDELRKRLRLSATTAGEPQLMALDRGMLSGYRPIDDACIELERLARMLGDEDFEVSK